MDEAILLRVTRGISGVKSPCGLQRVIAWPRGIRFHGMMRLFFTFLVLAAAASAGVPPALDAALQNFRGDPPRGWSYTQTTVAEGRSTVERYDATKVEFDRWSLVEKDGRPPTAEDQKEYAEMRSRRSRGGTAPKLTDQLDLATVQTVSDTAERATYRCGLRPGERSDRTAAFLRATVVVHKPTQAIESIELASTGEFSPAIGVKIAALKTLMTYTLPAPDQPAFPRGVTTHVRGRAFWFKSLDADMTVTYSAYEKAVRKK